MEIIAEGEGELIGWHDPDENRECRVALIRDLDPSGMAIGK